MVKDYARKMKILGPTRDKLLGNTIYYGISFDGTNTLISYTR
jgi:hypothetical protein